MEAFLSLDPAESFDGDRSAWAGTRADMAFLWGDSVSMRSWADTARRLVERELATNPADHSSRVGYASVLAYSGRSEDAMREIRAAVTALRRELTTPNSNRLTSRLYVAATVAAAAGERDAAIDWLRELITLPSPFTPARLRIDPFLKPLRTDPRFIALVAEPAPAPVR
jgi:hypothetical protein